MLMGRVLIYCNYTVFRSDLYEKDFNSRNPQADMDTLRNESNSTLPPLKPILEDNPLPPDVFVAEVLLTKYSQTIVN